MPTILGWGSGTWGRSTWGSPGAVVVDVNVTAVSATGTIGTVTTRAAARNTVSGVSGAGNVGTVVAYAKTSVLPSGVSGIGSLGTLGARAAANQNALGVSATGAVGAAVVSLPRIVSVSGLTASGGIGDTTVSSSSIVFVSTVYGTGEVGTGTPRGAANTNTTGVSAAVSVGSVYVYTPILLTGVSGTGAINFTFEVGVCSVYLTEVSATGFVAKPLVWGQINENQTPNWIPVVT